MPVLDLQDWTAQGYKFMSPLWFYIMTKQWAGGSCISVADDLPEENFFRCFIRHACFGGTLASIRKFAKHVGCAFLPTNNTGSLIVKLVMFEFGENCDPELILAGISN